MALQQTSIGQYFTSRKRQATDPAGDAKLLASRKVLILDENAADCHVSSSSPEVALSGRKILAARPPSQPRKTPVPRRGIASKNTQRTPNSAARKSLFPPVERKQPSSFRAEVSSSTVTSFEVGGLLSPMKKKREDVSESATQKETEEVVSSPALENYQDGAATPRKQQPEAPPPPAQKECEEKPAQNCEPTAEGKASTDRMGTLRKELGLSEIKMKLSRSSRLNEIRETLGRLKQGHDKLLVPQPKTPTKSPSLHQFKSIQLEVPTSPSKTLLDNMKEFQSPSKLRDTIFKSPTKMVGLRSPSPIKSPQAMRQSYYTSPRKLLEEVGAAAAATNSPPPAYQRYYSLVASGKPALILPYKYRTLAEMFRSVDTAVSMMVNRNETVTFTKLIQPVIELCKKNFTKTHLGQIQTVLPDAFKFSQEKVHQFGQLDKYHLVISPVVTIDNTQDNKGTKKNDRELFTPSVLLERKRRFYHALMEKAKDHHEEFLRSLDPPMVLSRDKLTRWHPEFDVESCPDIEPALLPQPPNVEKFSTAKDVLNKAREMFMMNPRMEKALQKISENNAATTNQPLTSAAAAIPALTTALKGIPKSLLEKVRARQAAKAMELLTRAPGQNMDSIELSRLPELARILKNLFIGEKKNVMVFKDVVTKLCSSYREILSPGDMEHHLQLIIDKVPGWLIFATDKKYLRMSKNVDLLNVMKTLEDAVTKNKI